jgi:hypothetical protein
MKKIFIAMIVMIMMLTGCLSDPYPYRVDNIEMKKYTVVLSDGNIKIFCGYAIKDALEDNNLYVQWKDGSTVGGFPKSAVFSANVDNNCKTQ